MSQHFKRALIGIGAVAILLLGVGAWLEHKIAGFNGKLPSNPATVLGKNDKEIVSYNSNSHILTTTTEKGTQKTYTRNPEIIVGKNGSVTVKKHAFGFERSPFLGIGYSSHLSVYLGLYLVDAWRFDLGPAISYSTDGLRPLLMLSYNVYSNTSVSFGYGIHQDFHLALTVRL